MRIIYYLYKKMKAMKILNNFQIMKNSNESCIAGQIFVYFSNVVLWATLIVVAFVVIFIPETPDKKFIGFLCLMGFVADFIFMASIEAPVLRNPFKKEVQEPITVEEPKKENVETIKEILPEVTEEFNQSVEKASQVKESDTLDHSLFD